MLLKCLGNGSRCFCLRLLVLMSAIMLSFSFVGVAGRNYKRDAAVLVNKEYYQIAPSVSLSNSAVEILSLNITFFRKLKQRLIQQHFFDLIKADVVLDFNLGDEPVQRSDTSNSHHPSVSPRHAHYRHTKRKTHPLQPPTLSAENATQHAIQHSNIDVAL